MSVRTSATAGRRRHAARPDISPGPQGPTNPGLVAHDVLERVAQRGVAEDGELGVPPAVLAQSFAGAVVLEALGLNHQQQLLAAQVDDGVQPGRPEFEVLGARSNPSSMHSARSTDSKGLAARLLAWAATRRNCRAPGPTARSAAS